MINIVIAFFRRGKNIKYTLSLKEKLIIFVKLYFLSICTSFLLSVIEEVLLHLSGGRSVPRSTLSFIDGHLVYEIIAALICPLLISLVLLSLTEFSMLKIKISVTCLFIVIFFIGFSRGFIPFDTIQQGLLFFLLSVGILSYLGSMLLIQTRRNELSVIWKSHFLILIYVYIIVFLIIWVYGKMPFSPFNIIIGMALSFVSVYIRCNLGFRYTMAYLYCLALPAILLYLIVLRG